MPDTHTHTHTHTRAHLGNASQAAIAVLAEPAGRQVGVVEALQALWASSIGVVLDRGVCG